VTASERRSQYLVETGRVEVERPPIRGLIRRRDKPKSRTIFPSRLKSLIEEVAVNHDVTTVALLSADQHARIVAARRELIRAMKTRLDYSGYHTAALLGLHHTTVAYHLRGLLPPIPFNPNAPDESGIWAI